MEKAILITRTQDLKYATEGYSRLYFGNEFCQRLIPSRPALEEVLGCIRKHGRDLSLVTPYVTQDGLKKLEVLFELLTRKRILCEIVANDWGVLNLVSQRYPNLTPVLGRLLTKQKRGPNIIRMLLRKRKQCVVTNPKDPHSRSVLIEKALPSALDSYYKGSNAASVPIIHDFLLRQRVRRIELDNIEQGLSLELPTGRIRASVYFPYVYITTTFFCPTAGCDSVRGSFLRIKPCLRPCQRYLFILRNRSFHKVLFLKGNTQFYKNSRISYKTLAAMGVDRVVYEPDLPL